MTDSYFALTVILEKEKRADDSEALIQAIKMMKGVLDVKAHIANPELYWAKETAAHEFRIKQWDALKKSINK